MATLPFTPSRVEIGTRSGSILLIDEWLWQRGNLGAILSGCERSPLTTLATLLRRAGGRQACHPLLTIDSSSVCQVISSHLVQVSLDFDSAFLWPLIAE